jgi:hypothetical protein
MELPLWIIAVTLVIVVISRATLAFVSWYGARTYYGPRTKFKMFLNWLLNGVYE